jgi:hypothetical protein
VILIANNRIFLSVTTVALLTFEILNRALVSLRGFPCAERRSQAACKAALRGAHGQLNRQSAMGRSAKVLATLICASTCETWPVSTFRHFSKWLEKGSAS